jgi:hypothetical protein
MPPPPEEQQQQPATTRRSLAGRFSGVVGAWGDSDGDIDRITFNPDVSPHAPQQPSLAPPSHSLTCACAPRPSPFLSGE